MLLFLQVELSGKHIIVNASERKMNVKFSRCESMPVRCHIRRLLGGTCARFASVPPAMDFTRHRSEPEAELWQGALEAQMRRVAEENAHQGRVLSIAVCKLKAQVTRAVFVRALCASVTRAQALLDQYAGPADPSLGVFVTVLAGHDLRKTGVAAVQSGVAKFAEGDDFCVYLPEGQQWRGSSSLKIVLMGSAHPPEDGHFKGLSCFLYSATAPPYHPPPPLAPRPLLHSGGGPRAAGRALQARRQGLPRRHLVRPLRHRAARQAHGARLQPRAAFVVVHLPRQGAAAQDHRCGVRWRACVAVGRVTALRQAPCSWTSA